MASRAVSIDGVHNKTDFTQTVYITTITQSHFMRTFIMYIHIWLTVTKAIMNNTASQKDRFGKKAIVRLPMAIIDFI